MPRTAPPTSPRRRTEPAPIGDFLGAALPPRVRRAVLDFGFLRSLWERAAPEAIARRAVPTSFESHTLTVFARDPATLAEVRRRRAEIARRLAEAAGLPGVRLRLRVTGGSTGGSADADPPPGAP